MVVDEVRPGPRDPPRLLGVGTIQNKDLNTYSYVDGSLFFTETDPLTAMLLLLSAFFVLGITWPSLTKHPLALLSAATLGAKKVTSLVSGNNKFLDLLKQLKLT